MPISKTEAVFSLVKSMTRSEKRTFRLFAERKQDSSDLAYMILFDLIDKQKVLDESLLKAKLGDVSPSKFSNLKRHLYEQILVTLRHINSSHNKSIKVREYIDYGYVLYDKGLYLQALQVLQKAKLLAIRHNLDFTLMIILEFEKMIHSRHITRSKEQPISQLLETSISNLESISNRIAFSNLRIQLHTYYIKFGHVQSVEEEISFKKTFEKALLKNIESKLGHMEQLHLYQSCVWYHYVLLDFESCYKYAEKWVKLFFDNSNLQTIDVNLFFRAYHYLLTAAFNMGERKAFSKHLEELERFRTSRYSKFSENTRIISFLYVHTSRLNKHILDGTFENGVREIDSTLKRIKRYRSKLDQHKIMILYYKISWLFLANNQAHKAVNFLLEIIAMTNISLRKDIQAYSRILFLMVHYELGNLELIQNLINVYRAFFSKNNIEDSMSSSMLDMFQDLAKAPSLDRKDILQEYLKSLIEVSQSKYEKRSFIYLDSISWIRSKTERKSLSEIVQKSNN